MNTYCINKKIFKFIALALGLTSLLSTSIAFADSCTRHISNKSHGNWTFSFSAEDQGYVELEGTNCPPDSTKCTLTPGGSITITYGYPLPLVYPSGTVYITDSNQVTRNFDFTPYEGSCPRIEHTGKTGAVAVNDPANGDLSAYGDYWNQSKNHK